MNHFKKLAHLLIISGIGLLVYSCANKAQGPTGGPKDVTPPKVLRSTPDNGALNFNKKQIQIIFDENITIKKASDNILISPPQIKQPDVKGSAKIVTIDFNSDLLENTTYTINFGSGIADLNEGNILKDYRFAFSTGNQIDTLEVSGTLINAEDQNPLADIYVGIYSADSPDSIFRHKPFMRIAKTNENGHFVIDNVKAGKYKVFALGDTNRDYMFQQGEGIAFMDSTVTPTFKREEMRDTIWKDSTHVDSIHTYIGTHYLPDNLILRYFKESKKRQYFLKWERKQPQSFSLIFNTKADSLPKIKPLNFDWDGKYMLQKNATKDTLTYWLTKAEVFNIDTLKMAMTYMKTDSTFQLAPQTDTINVIMRKAKAVKNKSNKADLHKKESYNFTTNANGNFEVYNPIYLKFDAPLENADLSKIHLSEKVDTILKPLPVEWRQIDSTKMSFAINYKWEPEKSYDLKIDSTAFRSIYYLESEKYSSSFKIKSLDEYSAIKVMISPYDSLAVLQVLDTKDKVLQTKPAKPDGTLFEYLNPGDFYLRAFIDKNRNGVWDTGEFDSHLQPEDVYYSPKKLSLRANWEFEETWNMTEVPLLKQKAAELKKDSSKKKSGN